MNNEDKMLQLVLSDNKLSTIYEYNADDFPTIEDAISSGNNIVVIIAKIIQSVSQNSDKNSYKESYNEIVNYLNQNIL